MHTNTANVIPFIYYILNSSNLSKFVAAETIQVMLFFSCEKKL